MKLLKRFIFATAVLLPISQVAEGRRGCCSHQGGVCSNQCCDGTQLSAKCGGGLSVIQKNLETSEAKKLKKKARNQATAKTGMAKAS
jgi:hypothetical protein